MVGTTTYDVFNGDADGICALVQLRLANPIESELVTGVKRDIALVQHVPAHTPAQVNVLDISLDKNRDAVDALLAAGSQVFYVDHHYPGEALPQAPGFQALIDTSPTVCTSLLVSKHLDGRFHHWAIVAAFGDNLNAVAVTHARRAGLSEAQAEALCQLGVCINYNGYGACLDDVLVHPATLFHELYAYPNPLDYIAADRPYYRQLRQAYADDRAQGLAAPTLCETAGCLIVALPDAPWARRISGVLGNELANAHPEKACAIVTDQSNGHFLVSIRAPLANRCGADAVARRFPTGGGREAAAGINALPAAQLDEFVRTMTQHWSA